MHVNEKPVFNKINMSNFVRTWNVGFRNGNSSRNAGSSFVLVFGIALSKNHWYNWFKNALKGVGKNASGASEKFMKLKKVFEKGIQKIPLSGDF
jgi:hypothetical protein